MKLSDKCEECEHFIPYEYCNGRYGRCEKWMQTTDKDGNCYDSYLREKELQEG